jgi:hypothetical protein
MADRFEDHLKVACPKCGIEQDPEKPVCSHMMGRKGGKISTEGRDMHELGRKGGLANRDQHGHEFYVKIGKMGGAAVLGKRGVGYLREIGAKGGKALTESAPPGHFKEIGTKGGRKTKDLCAAGKCALKKGGEDDE